MQLSAKAGTGPFDLARRGVRKCAFDAGFAGDTLDLDARRPSDHILIRGHITACVWDAAGLFVRFDIHCVSPFCRLLKMTMV